MSLQEKIVSIVAAVLDTELSLLTLESGAHNTKNWDSLASINIIIEVEKLIGRQLDLFELAKIKTIKDIIDVVENTLVQVE